MLVAETELELVDKFKQNRPELHRLACHLALVPRTEQRLLRGIRVKFHPELDPRNEHLLWFSDLVFIRNRSHIIFTTNTTKALAKDLDQTLTSSLWDEIQQLTRHWEPLDRLNRDLHFFSLVNDQQGLESVYRDMLRLIAGYAKDPVPNKTEILELARRIKFSTALLQEKINTSDSGRQLVNFAAHSLHDLGKWSEIITPEQLPRWMADAVPQRARGSLGLEIFRLPVTENWALKFVPTSKEVQSIEFHTPLPARLQVNTDQKSFWVDADIDEIVELDSEVTNIDLVTHHGKKYRVNLSSIQVPHSPPPETETNLKKIYLAHTTEDETLAGKLKAWLKEQDIAVELLEEFSGKSLISKLDPTVKIIRLWSSSMQKYWQHLKGNPLASSISSLMLKTDDTAPPTGFSLPGQMLDLRHWTQDSTQQLAREVAARIGYWAEGFEGEPNFGTVPDEYTEDREKLRAEIENPKTKPARRLEIGDRLDEIGDTRPGVGVLTIANPLIQKLVNELESAETLLERRLEIGNTFEDFSGGDPRPGTGLDDNGLPDIDWVKIPAGEFVYGEGKEETTRHLDAFEIARYPVTNAQYQAFISDAAYDDDQWWRGLKKPAVKESDWPQGNRPKINVDWFEATAFTRWLSHRLGLKITLPHETQWERAARGTTGLVYPWGNEYQSGYANLDETRGEKGPHILDQTTSVGIYLHAGSPEGVLDLAGNVWESCSNDYDRPTEKFEVPEAPVLRGGAWDDYPVLARAARRSRGSSPGNRNDLLGFRLLRSPPS